MVLFIPILIYIQFKNRANGIVDPNTPSIFFISCSSNRFCCRLSASHDVVSAFRTQSPTFSIQQVRGASLFSCQLFVHFLLIVSMSHLNPSSRPSWVRAEQA